MITTYLSGPMDDVTEEQATMWRQQFTKLAEQRGWLVLDPCRHKLNPHEQWREVVKLDKWDIHGSEAMVVYYQIPSVGTSMEILYAHLLGKIIVLVNPFDRRLSPWHLAHVDGVVGTLEEAADMIYHIHMGRLKARYPET